MSAIIPFDFNSPRALTEAQRKNIENLNAGFTDGIGGGSINRISIKSGRFRIIEDGNEVEVLPEPFIRVVLLAHNRGLAKTYYSKPYVPGQEPEQPDCASAAGDVPDAGVPHPQCATCAACPHNVWGSKISPTGSRIKACSDSKRLAVVHYEDIDGPAYQLSIPGASLNPRENKEQSYNGCVNLITRMGQPIPRVVTEVFFDTNAEYPKLLFKPIGLLNDNDFARALKRKDDPEIQALVRNTPAALDGVPQAAPAPAPVQAAPAPQPAPQPAPVVQPAPQPVQAAPAPAPVVEGTVMPRIDEHVAPPPTAPARGKKFGGGTVTPINEAVAAQVAPAVQPEPAPAAHTPVPTPVAEVQNTAAAFNTILGDW